MTEVAIRGADHRIGPPDQTEMVERAAALQNDFRARATETEQLRRLPDASFEQLRDAQFHRILQPVSYGGFGLDLPTAADVVRTVSSACSSTGWVANLFILHNFQVTMFGQEAQAEYWATSQDVMASTASFAPRSQVAPAPGGFRLTGRWKFSSGADFADWFIIMKPAADFLDWMLIPRSDVQIVDDWFVSGLCGTGSKDIVLDDVFVPEHRVASIGAIMTGATEGARLHDSPYGRMPFPQTAVWGIPPAIIGMVEGMADAVQQALVGKRALFTGELQVERVANQMRLAEVRTNIDVAKRMMEHRLAALRQWGEDGAAPGGADALLSSRDACFVSRLMGESASILSLMGGANGTYLTSAIQRFGRDVASATTHVSLNWEETAEAYGRALWQLPPKAPGG